MTKEQEIQLLYFFCEFVIEYGYFVEKKEARKIALTDFLKHTRESYTDYIEQLDLDEVPYFAQSSSNLVDASIYLAKFLGI